MAERLDEIRMTAGEFIAGRYRLTAPARTEPGHALWHAEDEILGRAVAVRLVCGPASRLAALHAAATRAGRLVHDGVAAIYDTGTAGGCVYIVREWVPGESLQDLLAAGPLDTHMVSELGVQLADILAAVAGASLHHQRLHLRNVVVTPNGGVKITDLETAGALDERHAPEAQWFGGVLYGALTARWPYVQLPAPPGLPQAVTGDDGRLCTPSQLRAGVPNVLDAVTMRLLNDQHAELGGADIQELADPLRRLPRTLPAADADEPPQLEPHAPIRRGRRNAWIGLTVGVLLAAIVGLWVIARIAGPVGNIPFFQDKPAAATAAQPAGSASAAAEPVAPRAMPVAAVRDYDPFGADHSEKPQDAPLAVNGKKDDGWQTEGYSQPALGGLKPGVGLVLDLGREVAPTDVTVTFGSPGTQWELRTADSMTPDFDATRRVGTGTADGATSHVAVTDGTKSRFWLVWLTQLPPGPGGYRGDVREIVVS